MEHLTAGEALAITIGGILAVCGAVSTIGGAVEKLAKAARVIRAPEQQQNSEIADIKDRLDKIEQKLENDKLAIEDSKQCNHVLTKGMLALLEHGINGNNIDQMRDARNGVEAYLINH
jgi:hypothetical protein